MDKLGIIDMGVYNIDHDVKPNNLYYYWKRYMLSPISKGVDSDR